MKKYIKDGKVAVLYSPGLGWGWSTWRRCSKVQKEAMIFSPELSKMVDESKTNLIYRNKVADMVKELFPGCYFEGLSVAWIDRGEKFMIVDDDGERIVFPDDNQWMTA